jgi:hypothetical protein
VLVRCPPNALSNFWEVVNVSKSVKPMITWVDLEDEADDLLDMELEDESQKTESTLEDIKVCDDPPMPQSTLHDQRVHQT